MHKESAHPLLEVNVAVARRKHVTGLISDKSEVSHPKLIKFLSDNLMDVLIFLSFPKYHHRKLIPQMCWNDSQ